MESPVVLEKPPEYHGKRDERGFPFDEEESGAWSSLAARHPDIAARLRQRPATWARKRRPSSQDPTDDFGDAFGFDRFPFDDIPPEFRESFPSHWGRREAQSPQQQGHPQAAPASPQPQQASAGTQTEADPSPHLPQYGLRNTVDLGQKSAADPSVEERGARSMSAPPDAPAPAMSAPEPAPAADRPHEAGNVRHIPIFVEGRDEPVINKNVDHGAHFADPKPAYAPPHVDRDQYFADDSPAFHHPPNFSRAFGTPFNKGFRQGPQPFTQQKAYPQAFRAEQRDQSPKRPQDEHFTKTHQPQQHAPPPPQQQQHPQQQQQHHPQQQQQQQPQQPPPHAPSPPPKQPTPNDPITVILAIQTDVLNLMSDVENFVGTKKDKRYLYLDEMLTRNLIKLDNIETDGKENIRQARKEAIKCIQKCIAVLEAKADGRSTTAAPAQDADMAAAAGDQTNGEAEMQETKEEAKPDTDEAPEEQKPEVEAKPEAPQPPDTRPEETRAVLVEKPEQEDKKNSPKKKVVKKRDKSKDNTPKDKQEHVETMQVDDKEQDSQKMEVDGASASQ